MLEDERNKLKAFEEMSERVEAASFSRQSSAVPSLFSGPLRVTISI